MTTNMNANIRNMWKIPILLFFICGFISRATCLNRPGARAIVVDGPNVNEGDDIMLSCAVFNVSGERAKTFRMEWRRDGVVLTRGKRVMSPDSRYRITIIDGVSDRRDFVLHIDRVNRNDTGRYVCWVVVRDWFPEIPAERASSSVELAVRYFPDHPRCFHDSFSDIFVEGTDVRFGCKVERGEPVVRTRWKGPRDTVLFAHETHGEKLIYNILTFQASSSHDGMVFTCEVSSDADVFHGLTSSCQVGPIEIIQGETQPDVIQSSSSFSEYSVDVVNAAFSELAPMPWTTKTAPINVTENLVPSTVLSALASVTPRLEESEKGFPIEDRGKYVEIGIGLAVVMGLLLVSAVLNIWLGYKLFRAKSKLRDEKDTDNNIVPSICSGVSNEEYMDMQDHRNYLNEGEFYSTIAGDTMRPPVDGQYASPRSSIAGPSGGQPRTCVPRAHHSNSIYENLGGRPVTPPRSKRKSHIFEEHIV